MKFLNRIMELPVALSVPASCRALDAGSAGSEAIIGGADNPTTIIVSSSVNWVAVIAALLILAAAIGLIVYFKRKK